MSKQRELVKILYIIPEGEEDAGQGEGLWAFSLGNQLYELQNIPINAEHLSVEDIVRCEESDDIRPVIKELVKRGGNRTLRVIFREDAPEEECIDVIWDLKQHSVFYEKSAQHSYMFNVEPHHNYILIRDYLKERETEGLLWLYEQPESEQS